MEAVSIAGNSITCAPCSNNFFESLEAFVFSLVTITWTSPSGSFSTHSSWLANLHTCPTTIMAGVFAPTWRSEERRAGKEWAEGRDRRPEQKRVNVLALRWKRVVKINVR